MHRHFQVLRRWASSTTAEALRRRDVVFDRDLNTDRQRRKRWRAPPDAPDPGDLSSKLLLHDRLRKGGIETLDVRAGRDQFTPGGQHPRAGDATGIDRVA